MAANFRIVVPARYASTRLPAKPLADIGGKPMIVRVLERVKDAGASETWVATDHEGVRDAVQAAGGAVVMTRPDHPSGTDRLAEVALARGWADEDIVVNVQGDEPLIDPAIVAAVAEALAQDAEAAIATAAHQQQRIDAILRGAPAGAADRLEQARGGVGALHRRGVEHHRKMRCAPP